MRMLYHVTYADRVPDIRETGLQRGEGRMHSERQQRIHRHMDRIGRTSYKRWVDRAGAVFAWTTLDRAVQYASSFEDAAIIAIEPKGTVWAVQATRVGDLYDGDVVDPAELEEAVDAAEVWRDEVGNNIEVWVRPHDVRVVDVFDATGRPFPSTEIEA